MNDCVFCRIAAGALPSHRIDEDAEHLALLDIMPAVHGQALVIPRRHLPSDVFAMEDDAYSALLTMARRVARQMHEALGAVRICMVAEGMEIDHARILLYPIHRVVQSMCDELEDLNDYRGYLSTKHGPRADDEALARLAAQLRADQGASRARDGAV